MKKSQSWPKKIWKLLPKNKNENEFLLAIDHVAKKHPDEVYVFDPLDNADGLS